MWKYAVLIPVMVFSMVCLSGCSEQGYRHLSAQEAMEMMEKEKDFQIVDVRTREEYDKKHIPGAILLPVDDIRAGQVEVLPEKNRLLMIYCWTGRRAEDAAELLVKMGYRRVYEFGGLVDWHGATVGGGN